MPRKNTRNTKGRIISAAWKLFYEQGYEDTTVEDIVFESETSKGSFYHYFDGKDALLGTLAYVFDEKYEELKETMSPELDAMEKLAYLNYGCYRAYMRIYGLEEPAPSDLVEYLDRIPACLCEYGSAPGYQGDRAELCLLDGGQPLDISAARLIHERGLANFEFYFTPSQTTEDPPEEAPVETPEETAPAPTTVPTESTEATEPEPVKPIISIGQQTVPFELKEGSSFNICGIVSADVGTLTEIRGTVTDFYGDVAIYGVYYPDSPTCDLRDTINRDLAFGRLSIGDYRYVLEAWAQNDSQQTHTVLIDQQFRVVCEEPEQTQPEATQPAQSASYAWSDWMTLEELQRFPYAALETETRNQYRCRIRRMTDWTTDTSMSGWSLYDTRQVSSGWSDWSQWQYEYVSANQDRDVETRQVQVSGGYTEYRYGRWYRDTADNNSYCYARFNQGGSEPVLEYTAWSTERFYQLSSLITCGNLSKDGREHRHINCITGSDGLPYWHIYSRDGSEAKVGRYFWEESRYVEPEYRTQYRYRVAQTQTQYRYYQCSSWSDWSTERVNSSDSCEVQTRQLYRVKYAV